VLWLDKVIVAEIQLNAGEASASSTAADNAFNAGSVVIAANGNFGPGAGTVRSPGNAHKALGIGAADLQTDALMAYSGRGPSTDGRFKPDLVFPTNIETARSGSDTALGSFGGTSAATPVSGGAAALLRNWMRGGTGSIDAGHVYSQMILGGQTLYVMECEPAAYAALAANEAEKSAEINVLEVRSVGSNGRIYLGGEEQDIDVGWQAAVAALEGLEGREMKGKSA